MLWINEGFVLDDAGNLLVTVHIDLREEGERKPVLSLVKGCRREHALEDGKTLLISKPKRFREFGPALIRDDQEGFVRKETITSSEEETPEVTMKRRRMSDIKNILELVGTGAKHSYQVESKRVKTENKSLSYGNDWWIFSTSIEPEESNRDAWKVSLDKDYDHVSVIGQPAKFAQALARMVAEQIGPLGKKASLTGTSFRNSGARTWHKCQLVFHGPVVYTDRLYDMLAAEENEMKRSAMFQFVKPATHAVQREYRFVVPNGGAAEQTKLLNISGMMRDALARTEGGLKRPAPTAAEMVEDDGSQITPPVKVTQKEISRRSKQKVRSKKKQETRTEIKDESRKVVSSVIEQEKIIAESVIMDESEMDDHEEQRLDYIDENEHAGSTKTVPEAQHEDEEEEVAIEIADGEREWNDEFSLSIPVVLKESGRSFMSIEEMFRDPTAPMPPASSTWETTACSPEEIVKSYGAITTLAMKIPLVSLEHRQDAASACWHALQCINLIYAMLGDVVDKVWIERNRFVVIHLKQSRELKATGRIVIGPSGVYAYYLKTSNSENLGHGEGPLGGLLFPLSHDVKTFESFGWSGKQKKPETAGNEISDE